MEFGFKSDTGRVREINQDAFFVMPEEKVFLVADGVGGHKDGELASRTAVADIADYIREYPLPDGSDQKAVQDYLESLLQKVNLHIFQMVKTDAPGGMATTLVGVYLSGQNAFAVNIGDSRLYHIRNGEIRQITEDHTYVNSLVKEGIITKEQGRTHPDRNMITRAIGAEESVRPDHYSFSVEKDDILLLCTDGLYNEISDEELADRLSSVKEMRAVCSSLVDEANQRGGRDNITIVSIRV